MVACSIVEAELRVELVWRKEPCWLFARLLCWVLPVAEYGSFPAWILEDVIGQLAGGLPFWPVGLQLWLGQREPQFPLPFAQFPVFVGVPLAAALPLESAHGRAGPRSFGVPLFVVAVVVLFVGIV